MGFVATPMRQKYLKLVPKMPKQDTLSRRYRMKWPIFLIRRAQTRKPHILRKLACSRLGRRGRTRRLLFGPTHDRSSTGTATRNGPHMERQTNATYYWNSILKVCAFAALHAQQAKRTYSQLREHRTTRRRPLRSSWLLDDRANNRTAE